MLFYKDTNEMNQALRIYNDTEQQIKAAQKLIFYEDTMSQNS